MGEGGKMVRVSTHADDKRKENSAVRRGVMDVKWKTAVRRAECWYA